MIGHRTELQHVNDLAKRIFKSEHIMVMLFRRVESDGVTKARLEIGFKDTPNSYTRFSKKLAGVPIKDDSIFYLKNNRAAVIELFKLAKLGMFK